MNKREAEHATYKQLKEENSKLRAENRWLEDLIATNKRLTGMRTDQRIDGSPVETPDVP
jgi:hypothetical protein